jgi:YfiH family protein
MISLIEPQWPIPKNVKAFSTTRLGGVSSGRYDSLNLGDHVDDLPQNVSQNRRLLKDAGRLPQEPVWLQQVHGTEVIDLNGQPIENRRFDAAYSRTEQQICTVMTADCLPVLFCSQQGDEVAAAHAGWRGLCDGILENTVCYFQAKREHILVWLGPAIGPTRFEVGEEVRQAFVAKDIQASSAFLPQNNDKYLADIYLLARLRLTSIGIKPENIYGGHFCTVTESERFFSYRRDKQTGRMASLIWLEHR